LRACGPRLWISADNFFHGLHLHECLHGTRHPCVEFFENFEFFLKILFSQDIATHGKLKVIFDNLEHLTQAQVVALCRSDYSVVQYFFAFDSGNL